MVGGTPAAAIAGAGVYVEARRPHRTRCSIRIGAAGRGHDCFCRGRLCRHAAQRQPSRKRTPCCAAAFARRAARGVRRCRSFRLRPVAPDRAARGARGSALRDRSGRASGPRDAVAARRRGAHHRLVQLGARSRAVHGDVLALGTGRHDRRCAHGLRHARHPRDVPPRPVARPQYGDRAQADQRGRADRASQSPCHAGKPQRRAGQAPLRHRRLRDHRSR